MVVQPQIAAERIDDSTIDSTCSVIPPGFGASLGGD